MTDSRNPLQAALRSPILWGILASLVFYALVHFDLLTGRFAGYSLAGGHLIERYFASHPVEYAATTMFFIGLASLALKLLEMVGQYPRVSEPLLGPVPRGGQKVEESGMLLRRLGQLPEKWNNDYLVRRLREAIEHVRRQGSAESLEDHLKYLADVEAARLHSGFALVRVIVWAIPILGFLGTVIGITLAIANLSPQALEDSLPEVTAGLGVAFDTTALALGLSILLMFAQFGTDRAENALLARVDQRAAEELQGRFQHIPAGPDGQLLAVRRMAETVIEVAETLVRRQAELWQSSMEAADARWAKMADAGGAKLQAALAESLQAHAKALAAAEQSAAEQHHRHFHRVQQAQERQIQAVTSLQTTLARQGEVLGRAIEATGQVVKLEEALNRNLAALAGAKNFEETVMSLAAAIHLLNARLADRPAEAPNIQLGSDRRAHQAA